MNLGSQRVLIVLDVDGVLNRLDPGNQADQGSWVIRSNGDGFWIRVDQQVVRALDDQVTRPGVSLQWLTTWDFDIDRLISGPLEGRLAGGNVMAARSDSVFVPSDWKLRALLKYLDSHGNPPYVWADDEAVNEAVNEALLFRPAYARASGRASKRLLLAPNPANGLSIDDVDRVRDFLDGVL